MSKLDFFSRSHADERFGAMLESKNYRAGADDFIAMCENFPNQAYCAYLAGLALQYLNDLPAATAYHERAVALDPENVETLLHLTVLLCEQHQFQRAQEPALQLLNLAPDHPVGWFHLSHIYLHTHRPVVAEHGFRRTLELLPHLAPAHFGLACTLIQRKKWAEAWNEFEWRPQHSNMRATIENAAPLWQNDSLDDASLVVIADQGHDDAVQFARFIPELAKLCNDIRVWAPPETVDVFTRIPGVKRASSDLAQLTPADYFVPLLSLPHRLQKNLDGVPPQPPYLKADPARVEHFRTLLTSSGNALCIGIVMTNDQGLTIPAAELAAIFEIPNIRWINLHPGAPAADAIAAGVEDWSTRLRDYGDVAALCANLDGVIGIASTSLHVAGAMQVPSIGLLQATANWRWGKNGERSAWYPAMTFTRQSDPASWSDAAAQAAVHARLWRMNLRKPVPTVSGDIPAPAVRV